jgi:hypothetical protein
MQMAEPFVIYGTSGNGKSFSIQFFGEKEILYINVTGKRLPFKKKFAYTMVTDDVDKIKRAMAKCPDEVKVIVIDDAGYLMTNQFMRGHSGDKSGGNTFDLFNAIADNFWSLINFIKTLPEDKTVYIIMHEDMNDFGQRKLRTIGKLLNEKVCIEGMCTVVLRAETMGGKYCFVTQNEGNDICKSPVGMFSDIRIPNDLKAVDTAIREYWGLTPSGETQEGGK